MRRQSCALRTKRPGGSDFAAPVTPTWCAKRHEATRVGVRHIPAKRAVLRRQAVQTRGQLALFCFIRFRGYAHRRVADRPRKLSNRRDLERADGVDIHHGDTAARSTRG